MSKRYKSPNCGIAIDYFKQFTKPLKYIKKEHKSKIKLDNDYISEIYNGDKWVKCKLKNASSPDYIIFMFKKNYKKSVLRVVEIHNLINPQKIIDKKNGFEQCWKQELKKNVICVCEDYIFIFCYAKTPIPRANILFEKPMKDNNIIYGSNCMLP